MEEVAIRIPSLGRLFDEWSPEPLEQRPLDDDARERILDAWAEGKSNHRTPERLCLILPATERQDGLEQSILTAFRHDMEETRLDSRYRWIRRCFAARETRIGLLVFVVAMVVSVLISSNSDGDSVETLFSQTFVVIAWVALWGPAGRFIRGATYRLEQKAFAELEQVPLEIHWQ